MQKLLNSRTFWTAVVMFLFNFFTFLVPLIPNVSWISVVVNILGFLLVSYFHVNPSQSYGTSILTPTGDGITGSASTS